MPMGLAHCFGAPSRPRIVGSSTRKAPGNRLLEHVPVAQALLWPGAMAWQRACRDSRVGMCSRAEPQARSKFGYETGLDLLQVYVDANYQVKQCSHARTWLERVKHIKTRRVGHGNVQKPPEIAYRMIFRSGFDHPCHPLIVHIMA